MTNFIPIFPLGIVVFPGDDLNLHIFEPRYKQLIQECFAENRPFGIPTVVDQKVGEFGTLVRITAIREVYDDGKMDISTRGLQVFRVLEVIRELPEKLYSGAIVHYPDNEQIPRPAIMKRILTGMREMHRLLEIEKPIQKPESELTSYDVAHLMGLSLEEEYAVLQLLREDQRLEYLKRHLARVLPIIGQMQSLKEKIRLNGHFRELKSLGFE